MLEVVDTLENADAGTLTLVVRDPDNAEDLGAYYHYAAVPPAHAGLKAKEWRAHIGAHALALEARSRGVEPPAAAHPQPGQLGASSTEPLSDAERAELEQARAEQAAIDQDSRDRAELEQLRAARGAQENAPG